MKFKIVKEKLPSGNYTYSVYENYWFFFWCYHMGHFDTLEEAEQYVIERLKEEKERRKTKKEAPVYYKLEGDRITYKKGDGIERGIMGERPLKFKKTENEK